MANISSSIFQVGYRYSSLNFLWRHSKLFKCLRSREKKYIIALFNGYLQRICEEDLDCSEQFLKEELIQLRTLEQNLISLQTMNNFWCRCIGCYKKRLEGSEDENIDNFFPCPACVFQSPSLSGDPVPDEIY